MTEQDFVESDPPQLNKDTHDNDHENEDYFREKVSESFQKVTRGDRGENTGFADVLLTFDERQSNVLLKFLKIVIQKGKTKLFLQS